MQKQEIVKIINHNLEKIIDDLVEALILMRKTNNDEAEEISTLFFVKRRLLDLTNSCFIIHHNLIKLKYLSTEQNVNLEKSEENEPISALFKDLK